MANRNFSRGRCALVKEVVDIYGKVAIGTTGAATLTAAASKGIASVARDGSTAGKYTITLQDKYPALLNVDVKFIKASGAPTAPIAYVISEAVATDKTIIIQCLDGDTPAATDPASGEVMVLHVTLANSGAI